MLESRESAAKVISASFSQRLKPEIFSTDPGTAREVIRDLLKPPSSRSWQPAEKPRRSIEPLKAVSPKISTDAGMSISVTPVR
jgi:hypothetical protein